MVTLSIYIRATKLPPAKQPRRTRGLQSVLGCQHQNDHHSSYVSVIKSSALAALLHFFSACFWHNRLDFWLPILLLLPPSSSSSGERKTERGKEEAESEFMVLVACIDCVCL